MAASKLSHNPLSMGIGGNLEKLFGDMRGVNLDEESFGKEGRFVEASAVNTLAP